MTKLSVYILQGFEMEPFTNLSGSPRLSGADCRMEVARITFPNQRNNQGATVDKQRFIDRFQSSRSERHVYLSKKGRHSTWQTSKDYFRMMGDEWWMMDDG